ncbi:unnamed protein product [Musa acuminata subsp. burmannicoides]
MRALKATVNGSRRTARIGGRPCSGSRPDRYVSPVSCRFGRNGGRNTTLHSSTCHTFVQLTVKELLYAGVDQMNVTWAINQSLPGATVSAYKKVKVKVSFCYAPASQADRGWRKTDDNLKKDKTCQFKITTQPYATAGSVAYTVERSIPTATFFVRAYVLDSEDAEVAYGQSTDAQETTNLFDVVGITGRHASLGIAAACFSAFSVVALAFFFVVEKRKAKK